MTDYSQLATAVASTLSADAFLGDSANVKTIETHKRGFSIQDNRDSLFFGDVDLPAIAVVPNSEPKESALTTTREQVDSVKAQVVAVSRDRDAQAGLDAHYQIVQHIETILEKQRSSTDHLGLDAFVRQVATEHESFKKGEFYYFVSTTSALIELTVTF
ncbi:MAG: hypothetical protein G3M78_03925 [Candidatus Nitrohelix vancouverensis]|uniref:Uncharacterized protein n=1 Tax=Candidatus Nitrohelix vancouverensis TaxID=2705534 RepID=A0A7T0C158_9BACT|nr:MAG: hypothetical protein G3M78_03925 [Candidatus Nitrohelix vancouverensis]